MLVRMLTLVLIACILATPAWAGGDREATLRQYVADGSEAARQGRPGRIHSDACGCARGTPLQGTGSMVFNCRCGAMQCVVVANTGESGHGQTPNLACR